MATFRNVSERRHEPVDFQSQIVPCIVATPVNHAAVPSGCGRRCWPEKEFLAGDTGEFCSIIQEPVVLTQAAAHGRPGEVRRVTWVSLGIVAQTYGIGNRLLFGWSENTTWQLLLCRWLPQIKKTFQLSLEIGWHFTLRFCSWPD